MKVLKFGGSSVASPESLKKVKQIVAQASEQEKVVVVVSAFGGITDILVKASLLAAAQDQEYREVLLQIEQRHLNCIESLIDINKQSRVISTVKRELNVLETLLEGAYLIGESTSKLLDKIVGYGELLSSYIISEYFIDQNMDAVYKDSRQLIKTDNCYGNSQVNFK